MEQAAITVRILGFGRLREKLRDESVLTLAEGTAVAGVIDQLVADGKLNVAESQCIAVAVNHEYAGRGIVLQDGDEVAILPPVSGGAGARVELVTSPIDSVAIQNEMKASSDGALCVFDGVVRDNTRGRATLHLEYEAYEEMALRQMHELRTEAISRFSIRDVAIVHRLGRLAVGETSVLIVVASAHRAAAFEACRWVIDTLKTNVPIWKREQFVDGVAWADGEPFPEELTGKIG
jgi:molybdopterin synthase catalytic subunit/molybdopterin converting factor small subunit